jgi:hypothetical protein
VRKAVTTERGWNTLGPAMSIIFGFRRLKYFAVKETGGTFRAQLVP